MASIIKLKRSLTPGSVPGSLEAGELAINIPDQKLFSSNGSNVFAVSGDRYNLTTTTGADPTVTLTVDNETLSNDAISFAGGTGITVTESSGTITIASTGTVSSADTLSTARDFAISGDITASAVSFDGSGNVTLNASIDAGVVDTAELADGAVTTAKIEDGQVTAAKIASGGITANAIASNAVTTAKIADAQITAAKIAAGGITANAIGNDSVALGTKTTGNYVAGITAGQDIVVSGSGSETATVTIALNDGISANTTGNAATATALATARAIQISGDVAGTANFDGTSAINIAVTQQNNSVDLGTHTTGNYVATVTGTANEITVSGSGSETAAVTVGLADNVTVPNNLTVTANTTVGGNLTVDGNLEVNGTLTYIDSTTVTIGDNMLKLANTNTTDTADLGFYSVFNDGSTKYTGLVRDASDGTYTLFTDLATEPDQTINFGNATTATLNAVIDGGTY